MRQNYSESVTSKYLSSRLPFNVQQNITYHIFSYVYFYCYSFRCRIMLGLSRERQWTQNFVKRVTNFKHTFLPYLLCKCQTNAYLCFCFMYIILFIYVGKFGRVRYFPLQIFCLMLLGRNIFTVEEFVRLSRNIFSTYFFGKNVIQVTTQTVFEAHIFSSKVKAFSSLCFSGFKNALTRPA